MSEKSSRTGRPRSDAPLDRPISVRLSPADRALYLEKVKASGMSQSDFFRECVITNRTKVVARAPASADRKRILFVVNKTGNNLNQLAHVANTQQLAGRISETTFVAILDELELIHQLLKAHLHRVD
jgi:hypothetical protein